MVKADENHPESSQAPTAAKGKNRVSASVNMVFMLPEEYSIQMANKVIADDSEKQSSATLKLSP